MESMTVASVNSSKEFKNPPNIRLEIQAIITALIQYVVHRREDICEKISGKICAIVRVTAQKYELDSFSYTS